MTKQEGFGPDNVPEGWDAACEYSHSQCDPTKFAPDELETFYPEDIRYMDLRNAFLQGVEWKSRAAAEPSVPQDRNAAMAAGLPFIHWSKDPLIPYDGCTCPSCEGMRQYRTNLSGGTL